MDAKDGVAGSLLGLATIHASRGGHAEEARRAFVKSVSTVESLRAYIAGGEEGQELFFADKLAPYHEVTGMLVREGREAEAFNYAEAGNGASQSDPRGGLWGDEG